MQIHIKKLHPDAQSPRYGTIGAGCFDLIAIHGAEIPPTFSAVIRTGLAFEVPSGWVMEVDSRSGHGFKNGVRLSNCSGQVDSDYRGEVMISLRNDGDHVFIVEPWDRIAQAKLVKSPRVEFVVVDELSETARGTGGFGSTGNA